MDSIVLNSIPFQLDTAALRKKLHIKEGATMQKTRPSYPRG